MTCEAFRFPADPPASTVIAYETYEESQRGRLIELVERTYEKTLDCAALNGTRSIGDVIHGYQATGAFRPQNWLFIQADCQDVGVLMLADHPTQGHWELMYMGIVPEFRSRRWGEQIARYALWLAGQAHAERVVLAVDEINTPARAMYDSAGFIEWVRRSVFVRFLGGRKN
jgi:mycothiol synthase